MDGRYYFLTSKRIQPHLLVGGTFPWFKVHDGSFLDDRMGDADFKGYGSNTEAGVTVYPHRQLGVSVGYNYRMLSFSQVTGVTDTLFELKPKFRETTGTVGVDGVTSSSESVAWRRAHRGATISSSLSLVLATLPTRSSTPW